MAVKYVMCFIVLLVSISAYAENLAPIVREEQGVLVRGVEEKWRLEWTSPPTQACSADEPDLWRTCPCVGFAFGERGNLVLVRNKPGHEEERFELTRLFDGNIDGPARAGEVVLRRWDVDDKDMDSSDPEALAAHVKARPITKVMRFGDYDHDGGATEFFLQVGTLPCGKKMGVVIGVSDSMDRLHAFSTVEHPEKPLILQDHQWDALLGTKGPITVADWICGDHGSDTETDLQLRADETGIHATRREYKCKEDGRRGQFINEEKL